MRGRPACPLSVKTAASALGSLLRTRRARHTGVPSLYTRNRSRPFSAACASGTIGDPYARKPYFLSSPLRPRPHAVWIAKRSVGQCSWHTQPGLRQPFAASASARALARTSPCPPQASLQARLAWQAGARCGSPAARP